MKVLIRIYGGAQQIYLIPEKKIIAKN